MRQFFSSPKIHYHHKRSFCFFYYEGKRIRIYNGKYIGQNIYPNKKKLNITNKNSILRFLKKLVYHFLLFHKIELQVVLFLWPVIQ